MENFKKEECCSCGVIFAVSASLIENWKKNKSRFYCPNGHSQSFIKSTAELLQEKLNEKQSDLLKKESVIRSKELEIFGLQKEIAKLKKKKIKK